MDLKYYKLYCIDPENIENYEKAKADNFKGWHCHHRLETHNSDGERRLVDISHKELKALGMYYNRPVDELIFLTSREHYSLHNKGESNPMYGKHLSEETKKKISEAHKNISEETRKKMSEAKKGKRVSEETRNKMSEAKKGNTNTKGMHWYNNGKINKVCYECPDGFVPGRLLINKGY